MAQKKIDKATLGYLGEEYQRNLVKCLIEDPDFLMRMERIIEPAAFTDDVSRILITLIKDRIHLTGVPPKYGDVEILCRSKIRNGIEQERAISRVAEMRNSKAEFDISLVVSNAERFFIQQNFIKSMREASDIMKDSDASNENYLKARDIMVNSLDVTSMDDVFSRSGVFDEFERVMNPENPQLIPTGACLVDVALGGGLKKGTLGIIIAPTGVGKSQPVTARIVTPDGYRCMGDIKAGDEVIGRDGKAHKVTAVYPQGIRPIYRLSFSNGDTCECDIEHLWTVIHTDGTESVITLKEIMEGGVTKEDGNNKYRIPRIAPVEFPAKETQYDSYAMGYIVGSKTTMPSSTDEEESVGFDYIPHNYLWNDLDNRKKLLRGLLDGINACSENGRRLLHETDISLYQQMRFLARSLGFDIKVAETGKYPYTFISDDIYITKVDLIRYDYAQCIMVDSDDHTYATGEFVVTHNTSSTTGFAAAAAVHRCAANNYQGWKVLHIFFEDDMDDIKWKYYGWVSRVNFTIQNIRQYHDVICDGIRRSGYETLISNNVQLRSAANFTVGPEEIEYELRRCLSLGFKADLVVIDYFGCLKRESGGAVKDDLLKEEIMIRKIESICKKFNVAVWLPIQGNRESIGASFVGLTNAGGSISKIQAAGTVISLARTEEQRLSHRINIQFLKGRMVPTDLTCIEDVSFNNGTCRFDFSDKPDLLRRYNIQEDDSDISGYSGNTPSYGAPPAFDFSGGGILPNDNFDNISNDEVPY